MKTVKRDRLQNVREGVRTYDRQPSEDAVEA